MPMPRASPRSPVVPVLLLLIAMGSIQAGASLAKTLFHSVGAPGAVTLRTALATIMLVVVLRPWRARLTADSWRPLAVYGDRKSTRLNSSHITISYAVFCL